MSYKTFLKSFFRNFGLSIHKIPTQALLKVGNNCYSEVIPSATLSPWLADAEFMDAYNNVKDNTLLDIYRLYELWSIVEQTHKVDGAIVEIGVWRGGSGCLMALKNQLINNKSDVYLCDTFEGVVKAGEEDTKYKGGEHKNTSQQIVEQLAKKISVKDVKILKGIFPNDTGTALKNIPIRLLHIDVDVYQSAKDSVEYVFSTMPSGAVIVFDDYGFVGCDGITKYADELRKDNKCLFIHNINGHALIIKL